MLLLPLLLAAAAQTVQPAQALDPAKAQQAYDLAVNCSAAHMVASVVGGQMGDAERQAHLRRMADNFKTVSIGFGGALGVDQATVVNDIAETAAARIAPLDAMATAPDRQAGLATWSTQLNEDLALCTEFAAKLAAR